MSIEMNLPGGAAEKPEVPAKKAPTRQFARYRAIEFNGSALEYFMVWIVNLLLTFITIGIYGPWAKVRRINYFHNNTVINGFGMGYHATGGQIFKGRLVALVIIIIANLIASLDLMFAVLVSVVFFFLMPLALNRSLSFSARNTSWRNIRLQWHGNYWGAFMAIYVVPLVSLISFGLLGPLMTRIFYNFYANNHSFGTTPFTAELETGQAYAAFFTALISALVVTAGLAGLAVMIVPAMLASSMSPDAPAITAGQSLAVAGVYLVVAFFFIFNSVNLALCRNYLLQSLRLGSIVRFESVINPAVFIWIVLSNYAVMLLTFGLMIPWASVRRYNYLCSATEYKITGDINNFVDEEIHKQNALGEEFAEMEGLEFGI